MSSKFSVRNARPDDAEAVARVNVASHRAAYRGLLQDVTLDALSVDDKTPAWRARLAHPETPEHKGWVVEADGEIVGYAFAGPARDLDTVTAGGIEIYGFYIHPDHWGKGAGRALMEAVLADFGARGYPFATLNVLEDNGPARRFYERLGWRWEEGVRQAPWEGSPQVRYRLDTIER